MEQIILPKNIFLAYFMIVQKIHYFCKFRACRISVKNSNFQNLPKIVENSSLNEWNKQFCQKNIFLAHFKIVQNFKLFL